MRSLFAVLFAVTLLAPETTAAQSVTAVAPAVADTIAAAVAPVVKKKKKGGLFGKVKGLAKNKVVKSVAKVALCTAVPGGSMIVGALDAAETKDAAGAAAGIATGAGGGGSCMPGMAGMAGGAGTGVGAGLGAGAAGALAGASAPTLPGQPSTGMPGMGMSPEQLKQMQEQYKKMGMDPAQLQAMQQMMAGTPAVSAEAGVSAGAPLAARGPALSREKGKMLLRRLPWVPGSDALQEGGAPVFGMTMQEVAVAIKATGKRYKIEARVEEQGDKSRNRLLSQKRGAAILAALVARGVAADRLTVSDGKADKDPRIIVSEGK